MQLWKISLPVHAFLWVLKKSGIAATGIVRAHITKKAPLQAVDDMKKQARGISDIVNNKKSCLLERQ